MFCCRKRGTTAFIASAVEERLRMNIEYIDQWHKALALHASPFNTLNALNNLTTLVDHIWYYAGDRSTDVRNSVVLFLIVILSLVFHSSFMQCYSLHSSYLVRRVLSIGLRILCL